MTEINCYDELPFDDLAFFHTHPSNLAVGATLRGLTPPGVESCRVLELGCGAGFNLLAMTQSLPGAEIVGVDLSPSQVEHGQTRARRIGAKGLQLHAMNILDIGDSLGRFDYVIAHGVYSWMPPAVRREMLPLYKRLLNPNGIGYISYNTYPGWRTRSIIRDLFRFHAAAELPPADRARQAQLELESFVAELPDADSIFAKFLKQETESLRDESPSYLFHEFLELDNDPMYFEEFARSASDCGLQFVAEARYETNSTVQIGDINTALDHVGSDLLRREQKLDFLFNRFSRQSLLAHDDATINPPAIGSLRIRSDVRPLVENQFQFGDDCTVTINDPFLKAGLQTLIAEFPKLITVQHFVERIFQAEGEGLPPIPPLVMFASLVRHGFAQGYWQLYAFDPPFAAMAGDSPIACPVARHEAGNGVHVTNRLHRPVKLTEVQQRLLLRLDGKLDREQLIAQSSIEIREFEAVLEFLANSALLAG